MPSLSCWINGGNGIYLKHALTQEVAYSSVLIERRRLLHERAGEAIEALYKDRIDDHLADYSRSASTRKAVEYLFRAGSQAAARSAHSEAVTRLSSAVELLKHLPDDAERARQELSVQSVLGRSLAVVNGDCFDNAMCESFFATLECELLDRRRFHTQAEARMVVAPFVVDWRQIVEGGVAAMGIVPALDELEDRPEESTASPPPSTQPG